MSKMCSCDLDAISSCHIIECHSVIDYLFFPNSDCMRTLKFTLPITIRVCTIAQIVLLELIYCNTHGVMVRIYLP